MKNKKKLYAGPVLKLLIRGAFFVIYPALFSTAWTAVKMLVETIMNRGNIIPLNSFTETLAGLLLFTIIFGRFFCGFACALGSWGDFVYAISSWIRSKQRKRPLHLFAKLDGLLRYMKYLVAAGVIAAVISGRGSLVSDHSPFFAFSRLHSALFNLQFPVTIDRIGLVLFLLITVCMALEPRFFCRFLCPMGAVFSLMPVLPFSVVKRNRDNCNPRCLLCKMDCPAHLDIPYDDEGDNALSGECLSCGKCIERCPRSNIHNGFPGRAWLPMLVLKAGLLFGIFWLIY